MKISEQTILHTIIALAAIIILGIYLDSFPFLRSIIATIKVTAMMYYYNAQIAIKKEETKTIETATGQTARIMFAILTIVFFIDLYKQEPNLLISSMGIILMIIGAFLYSKSAIYLDKLFSTDIEIKQNHELITTGPFAIVRHPAYASSAIFYVGMALSANSIACLAIFLFCFVPWYFLRIRIEEKMLEKEFNTKFTEYKNRVPALLPKLF